MASLFCAASESPRHVANLNAVPFLQSRRAKKAHGLDEFSLPDPGRDYVQDRIDSGRYASASDYVRDLIRRDQDGLADEERWLRDLDASIAESLAEMRAGLVNLDVV